LSDHQRQIDSAECTAIAMQTVPLPNIAMPQASSQPAPRSYRVMGNTTTLGPGGITHGTFQSTVRAAPAGGRFAEVSRQMAATDARNQRQARRDAAVRVREDLAGPCLRRRGWCWEGVY